MGRHLDVDTFTQYSESGVPVDHVIPGEPRLVLFFDPVHSELGLRLLGMSTKGDEAARLVNISVRRTIRAGDRVTEVYMGEPKFFGEGYGLLCSLADRIQVDSMPFDAALAETVRAYGQLVEVTAALGTEREVGLFAELSFLERLLTLLPQDEALGSWVGPDAEEHDFSLSTLDVEIKGTLSERRSHWIESLTQLTTTPHRALWLVSYQLTRGGASSGMSLADLIDRIRGILDAPGTSRFNETIASAGWSDDLRTPDASRYLLRSEPAAYAVDQSFPRLDSTVLASGGAAPGIKEVRYRIDLSDRPADHLPAGFQHILTTGDRDE